MNSARAPNTKKKHWSNEETIVLLQEAIDMRVFRYIDGKNHKNKEVSGHVSYYEIPSLHRKMSQKRHSWKLIRITTSN